MRKIKSMILAAILVLSMAGLMVACGKSEDNKENKSTNASKETPAPTTKSSDKDEAQTPDTGDNTDNKDNASAFPEALSNVQAYPVPDIAVSGWQFSGGMINGTEMEQSEANAILQACGGVYQFIFLDEGKAQMINGDKIFEGTYKAIQDNYAIEVVFDGYEYYGVFTAVNEETVLILVNKAESEIALYFLQMDEG